MAAADGERLVYVIPAYNEGRAIGATLRGLQLRGLPGEIIVVDDASGDNTAAEARAAGALVLRHVINRGQGAALQTGFDAALRLGADIVVTFDADGQHRAEDVERLVRALRERGAEVALGSRFLGEAAVAMPPGRRLTLQLGLWFTRIVSRIQVTDTHNGLRAFRSAALRRIRILEDRMAHASELLDLIASEKLKYVEVPCQIRYTEYSVAKGQRWHAALGIVFDFFTGKVFR